ncbi:MAG: HesA/MoeB/ThiF family protein [Flavobacteriia bacterium]|nr:HesA/MoeB/ThiF family protein [Flavobacteriia bacterium]
MGTLTKEEQNIYNRQIILSNIGIEGQQKIKEAKVLVVGAGGLGCPVLRYLAAAGVGEIGIVDFDSISISNLQRQILYDFSDVNKNKALVAKEKLSKVNPYTKITAFTERFTTLNAVQLVSNYNFIVDCTDNYETRFLVNDACVLTNRPFVYGSIYKFEGQISVFNYQNGPTYRCLFKDYPSEDSTTDCNAAGVLGVLPGIIGLYQANEVLKMILGIGEVLSGKLIVFNALTNQSSRFKLTKRTEDIYVDLLKNNQLHAANYHFSCSLYKNNEEIGLEEFEEKYLQNSIQIIDVRNHFEEPIIVNEKIIKIPMNEIEKHIKEISKTKETILFCKSGKRSLSTVLLLKEKYNFQNVKSLHGGISEEVVDILTNYE